jgi:hypothetical protein
MDRLPGNMFIAPDPTSDSARPRLTGLIDHKRAFCGDPAADLVSPVFGRPTCRNMHVRRYLGLDVVGGHHTHISRRIRALGIDTSHFAPNGRTGVTKNERRRRTSGELLIEQEPTRLTVAGAKVGGPRLLPCSSW